MNPEIYTPATNALEVMAPNVGSGLPTYPFVFLDPLTSADESAPRGVFVAGPGISYFLTGVGIDDFPCAPPKGKAGATGLVLSFLGFFCSRLLRICPLAISDLLTM